MEKEYLNENPRRWKSTFKKGREKSKFLTLKEINLSEQISFKAACV